MKIFFLIIILILSTLCQAQDTTKVLFIGNSFTSENNLPALFQQLAQGAGNNVLVDSHMPGGVSVGDISQGTSAHMNNPQVYSLIKSNDWDYLVLQDNQGRFCLGYGQFPSSSLVIAGHLKILDSLLFYNPCAHMILFAGFGPKNGYPPYGNTGSALIDNIYQNYQFINDTAHQIIAPIGPAFLRIISGYPAIDLWGGDAIHPSLNGSFLIACAIFTTIFKSTPLKSSYNPGFSMTIDSLLKNTAYQTSVDSINSTGLIEITPVINQSGNSLSISSYQSCNWFYNNSPFSSNNCLAIINQSGYYYSVVTDNNGCKFITLESAYFLTSIPELSTTGYFDITIHPNPTHNNINVKTLENSEIQILDLSGHILKTIYGIKEETTINLDYLPHGFYILRAISEKGIAIKKFIKR